MARLFKLALESSDLEGAVSGNTQPALDETELEQNVEETVQEQAEIEQGEEEVEQALEEAEVLAEQVEANDAKLENPDEVVTAADVEVSEEALKRACYSLGIPMQSRLSFASESNDIRSNARKYLATSNESVKDVLKAIIDALKVMIKSLGRLIKEVYLKVAFKMANYTKQIENSLSALKDVKGDNLDADKVKNALSESNTGEVLYALINNTVVHGPAGEKAKKPTVDTMEDLAKSTKNVNSIDDNDAQKAEELSKKIIDDIVDKMSSSDDKYKFGFKKPDIKEGEYVIEITGNKALVRSDDDNNLRKAKLEKDDAVIKSALNSFNVDSLLNSATSNQAKSYYLKEIKDFGKALKAIKTIQACTDKFTYSATKITDGKAAKWKFMAIKSVGITMSTFQMDKLVNEIRAYVKILKLLADSKK